MVIPYVRFIQYTMYLFLSQRSISLNLYEQSILYYIFYRMPSERLTKKQKEEKRKRDQRDRQRRCRAKKTSEQKKIEREQRQKSKENWLAQPGNREKQRQYVRRSKAKRKAMEIPYEEFLAQLSHSDDDSGMESCNEEL